MSFFTLRPLKTMNNCCFSLFSGLRVARTQRWTFPTVRAVSHARSTVLAVPCLLACKHQVILDPSVTITPKMKKRCRTSLFSLLFLPPTPQPPANIWYSLRRAFSSGCRLLDNVRVFYLMTRAECVELYRFAWDVAVRVGRSINQSINRSVNQSINRM